MKFHYLLAESHLSV